MNSGSKPCQSKKIGSLLATDQIHTKRKLSYTQCVDEEVIFAVFLYHKRRSKSENLNLVSKNSI
ncbi:hypothetical protein FIU82_17505 (plasmid) [Pseudoalteromonas sp. THAF3]|nr:hypothetical protein FIU82_17505 [Pseudoalteromonas sp. THAF3]